MKPDQFMKDLYDIVAWDTKQNFVTLLCLIHTLQKYKDPVLSFATNPTLNVSKDHSTTATHHINIGMDKYFAETYLYAGLNPWWLNPW